jgi:deoxycytidine triphosphate deaminase
MLLGTEKLLKLVKEVKLVEGLSERELHQPEGAGFDLRLGEIYQLEGSGFLGIAERETPRLKLVAKFAQQTSFRLKAGHYYVVKTLEKVNLPLSLAATFRPRSTLYRSGIGIFSGNVAPGYRGEINVGLYNFSPYPFVIELGARFLHIMFWEIKGEVNQYRGQWQGGRTTTPKREKQV